MTLSPSGVRGLGILSMSLSYNASSLLLIKVQLSPIGIMIGGIISLLLLDLLSLVYRDKYATIALDLAKLSCSINLTSMLESIHYFYYSYSFVTML